jgi:hypothetical protein
MARVGRRKACREIKPNLCRPNIGPFRRILFKFPSRRKRLKGIETPAGKNPTHDSRTGKLVKPDFGLAHLHFLNLFFAPNRACGPEVPPLAGLRGKSIGGERIPSGDPPWLPQNGAGRSGARSREARDAPTSENPSSRRKIGLPALYHTRYRARPGQGMIRAS